MNYTENYQLPQWVESDRVLMDDFNDAMDKTDTALLELEMKKRECKLLKQESLSIQTERWDISLGGIDCTKWQFLLVEIYLKGSGVYLLRPNGSAEANYQALSGSMISGGLAEIRTSEYWNVILMPFQSADRPVTSLTLGPGLQLGYCNPSGVFYKSLSSFVLFPNFSGSYLSAGSQMKIWGM